MSFYDLSIYDPAGNPINMSDFNGKAVLIVNTATKCGLTPQFDGLESLYQKYKDQGLIVLGFPCNQFLSQSPESNETVVEVCRINHGVTFPLTEKIDVNGADTHPIFVYLKKKLGGMLGSTIKWNFTKFLIAPDGKPYKRFSPKTEPEDLEADIIEVLKSIHNA
ncbi:glutathione peroxidase [Cocleimonas flava]|uniref:Glutathione peroxidase n=1 Tax=Cocleimonas flava TaxID=634765 RepID=A0A4R1EVJ9_9GAMM|nr:glutathione peroxidase [Cocleimonas flava]TCJ83158.1 glutathione peroxidase [Cocleimonas flava]